jgi:hypothetical protein
LRNRIGERNVDGLARAEVALELVGQINRTGVLAQATAGAVLLPKVAGLLHHGDLEAVAGAPNLADLGVGHDGDVVVVCRRGHSWSADAAGTVEGRKDLAERNHLPADARLPLDDENAKPLVRQIKSCLQPGDAAAHDQRVVFLFCVRHFAVFACGVFRSSPPQPQSSPGFP